MKKAFYVLSALIVLLAITIYLTSRFYAPKFLSDLEDKIIADAAKIGYNISYDELEWSMLSPGVRISNLRVKQYTESLIYDDTDTLKSRDTHFSEIDSIFRFNVEIFEVNLKLMNVLSGNFMSISDFRAQNGELIVFDSDLFLKSQPAFDTAKKDAPDHLNSKKENIDIDQFIIKNIVYEVMDNPAELRLHHLQGSLFVDRQSEAINVTIPKNNLTLAVSDITFGTIFPLHSLAVDSISYHMSTTQFKATGLNIRPNQNRAVINYEQPFMLTHTSVSVPEVIGSGFKWSFNETFAFRLEHLELNRLFLNLYQNMEKPIAPAKKSLPTAWIADLSLDFLIDTVQIRNSQLNYTETRTSETLNPANFWMDEWNLTWAGYGTSENRPTSHTVSSKMRMMGGAPVNVRIDFPYLAENYGFTVVGGVSETRFDVFNPVLEPLEGFHFRSGVLKEARFTFDADDFNSSGLFLINFDEVRIGLSRDPKFRQRVMAWAANRFVIQSNSSGESIEIEIGKERDQYRSFANFLAQTLKDGLVEALLK